MEKWCCDKFKECNEKGTDAEGYDSAINFYEENYRIGDRKSVV